MSDEAAAPTADKLVETYVKIRDAKRELEREMNDRIAAFDEQLDTIEAELQIGRAHV